MRRIHANSIKTINETKPSFKTESFLNESIKSEQTDESSRDETLSDVSNCSLSTGSDLSDWIKSLIFVYRNSENIDTVSHKNSENYLHH